MKIDGRKIVIGLFLSLCLGFTLFAGTEVQIPGTQQAIVVQVQNQNDSSLEKQIEFSLNNILPGIFKGVLEGASSAAAVTNGFGKLPEHQYKDLYPLLTDGLVSGFADVVREDEEELCQRDEGYVSYLTEKGIENFSKYLVGLLLIAQCDGATDAARAVFLTQWVNSLCRGQEFTRGKILKFLLTLGTRGVTEGISVNAAKQVHFSAIDGTAGVLGGLIPELCVKFGLGQKNGRGKVITRVASTAMTMGCKIALQKALEVVGQNDVKVDLCKIPDLLVNTKVIGGTAAVSALTLLLVKNGLRPRDILDMIKVVKQIGPTIRTFVGF